MLKKSVQASFLILGGTLGIFVLPPFLAKTSISLLANGYVGGLLGLILGAIVFYALTFWAVHYVVDFIKYVEEKLVKAPVTDILFGGLGFVFGLIIAFLIAIPFRALSIEILNNVLPAILTILFGYLGFQVGYKKRHEIINLLTTSRGGKKKSDEEEMEEKSASSKLKILDTSVIIDGRIADICQTGFLEGTIVIPQFVLGELQYIADSSDSLKRNRGRRGLDVLKRIQKELHVKVEIYEGDFEEIHEVDSKLVKLAKLTNGIVVTNDFNLNKVCEVQGVSVLNINDLSNAVKPVLLPGEEMRVFVVKDGKEHNQGVAYLDDGTMIVIEDGRGYIGKDIEILVTSVLQTSAGRMIFAKSKALEKAQ